MEITKFSSFLALIEDERKQQRLDRFRITIMSFFWWITILSLKKLEHMHFIELFKYFPGQQQPSAYEQYRSIEKTLYITNYKSSLYIY